MYLIKKGFANMYDETYLQMKHDWKNIISFGPRPFGSLQVRNCSEYLEYEMSQLYPDTKIVSFFSDGFEVDDWQLMIGNTIVDSYLMLGSGTSEGFSGKLQYAGIHRVWETFFWNRYMIIDSNDNIVAYITVRKNEKCIPQTIAEGNTALPHFIVGQQLEEDMQQAIRNDTNISGYSKAKVLADAEGRNIVVPAHRAKSRLVLLAHYDTVYNTPGAYDNAAGTAVLMEVARRLKSRNFLKGLDIIFTDGEEFMLLGSKYLAENDLEGVEMVLNIDGVGDGDTLEIWSGPETFERQIRQYLKNKEAIKNSLYTTPPPPGSDHSPYYDFGIPVCMFTFNDQGTLHTPDDVYDEKKLSNMALMVQLVLGFLEIFEIIEPA